VLEEGFSLDELARVVASMSEAAREVGVGIRLEESAIPVAEPVAGACELLGLDPLYVANEGRLVAFVPAEAAEAAEAAGQILEIMRSHPASEQPAIIGTVTDEHPGTVELRGMLGAGRIIDLLSGEQMPRICWIRGVCRMCRPPLDSPPYVVGKASKMTRPMLYCTPGMRIVPRHECLDFVGC